MSFARNIFLREIIRRKKEAILKEFLDYYLLINEATRCVHEMKNGRFAYEGEEKVKRRIVI